MFPQWVYKRGMNLREHLKQRGTSVEQFAAEIGRSVSGVKKWLSGERIPDREAMPLIIAWSRGQVRADDFYDVPAEALSTPEPQRAAE